MRDSIIHRVTLGFAFLATSACGLFDGGEEPCEGAVPSEWCCVGSECDPQGDGVGYSQHQALRAVCEFRIIKPQNLEQGHAPYDLTPECRTMLKQYIPMSSGFANEPETEEAFLRSIHYLFFHPIFIPDDDILFTDEILGTDIELQVPALLGIHAAPIPDSWNYDLMYMPGMNTEIVNYFFEHISLVHAEDQGMNSQAVAAFNSQTAKLGIYDKFQPALDDPRWGAAVIYHELVHVPTPGHLSCSDACGEWDTFDGVGVLNADWECDCNTELGSYANQSAMLWSMIVGGLVAHTGDGNRILTLDDPYLTGTGNPEEEGGLFQACKDGIVRIIPNWRSLHALGKSPNWFCRNLRDATLLEWSTVVASSSEPSGVGPTGPMPLTVCDHTASQPDWGMISIEGDSVVIPRTMVDTTLENLSAAMSGSWAQMLETDPYSTVTTPPGLQVTTLWDASIFAHVGFQPGDYITEVDGIEIDDLDAIMERYADLAEVSEVRVTLRRYGQEMTIKLIVDEKR